MSTIKEPAKDISVSGEFDICVIGGSCTGVAAAVSAARLGAKVCIIEWNGCFGGAATAGLGTAALAVLLLQDLSISGTQFLILSTTNRLLEDSQLR
jgi:glycine/D-amino acid oxidase-like deaminating enzyme